MKHDNFGVNYILLFVCHGAESVGIKVSSCATFCVAFTYTMMDNGGRCFTPATYVA